MPTNHGESRRKMATKKKMLPHDLRKASVIEKHMTAF
jgi:hypothetical protein